MELLEITGSLAILYQQLCDSYTVKGSLWTIRDCVAGCSYDYNAYWSDHFCLSANKMSLHPISIVSA